MKRTVIATTVLMLVFVGIVFVRTLVETRESALKTVLFEGETMATTYSVKVVDSAPAEEKSVRIADAIKKQLKMVNQTMSRYENGGELYAFNQHRSVDPFPMSKDALAVMERGLEISRASGGAFDMTVGPLIRLWGFHDKSPRVGLPTGEEISRVKEEVGYEKLRIDPKAGTLQKTVPGLDIDMSAIAKGHAVDLISEALSELGHRHYMVEVGGEVRARGKNDRGELWRIGVEKPVEGVREILRVVALKDAAMATSGDYRSFYKLDGKRMSHTIDPVSGAPISHGLASVTVIHGSCMVADAIATTLTVLGPKKGMVFAREMGFAAFFIARGENGGLTETMTPAFRNYIDGVEGEK